MREAVLQSRRKRATPKRVMETTAQKIKRLEASIGNYLRDNMQAELDRAAADIRKADARDTTKPSAPAAVSKTPAPGAMSPAGADRFLSELYQGA